MRVFRIATAGSVLFLASIAAHTLGGGKILSSSQAAMLVVAGISLSACNSAQLFEGPRLALLILVAQSFTHVTFSSYGTDPTLMFFYHLFFGLATYFLISYLDLLIVKTIAGLTRIFLLVFSKVLIPLKSEITNNLETIFTIISRIVGLPHYLRAPPLRN